VAGPAGNLEPLEIQVVVEFLRGGRIGHATGKIQCAQARINLVRHGHTCRHRRRILELRISRRAGKWLCLAGDRRKRERRGERRVASENAWVFHDCSLPS
jgi:hypothetical protein